MKLRLFMLFTLAFLGCSTGRAGDSQAARSLSDVAWLQGHWVMESEAGRAEEIWMAPRDGSMVGSFRWAGPGMHVLEFLVIEEKDGVVTLRFKHFDRNYRAWEDDAANTYRLAETGDRSARFDNVAWNGRVPQYMRYSIPSEDRLSFRGESPDGDGEPLVLEYRRAD
ncbi:MAG: DUF6265 family protein [Longimicrobiales bacterium]